MWIWSVVIAWGVLLFAWGRFWRADQRLGPAPEPATWPEIAILIPARDEAETIAEVVRAHMATDYPGKVRCVVVDDNSSDGTGDLARAAGADVLPAPPLAEGWSGKLWALNTGLGHVARIAPDATWVLLTDADIRHGPDTLRKLVAKGEAEGLSLVSLMARLDARGAWGGLLIPAFVFFFQKLYPFPWVNLPRHWCAGAAGGCVLIRQTSLHAIGGIDAIRDALIDDCTLGARVKHTRPGRTIWLGLAGDEVVSLRDNRSLASIWNMVARTAFTQLHYSALLLAGAVLGMGFLYLLPIWLLLSGISGGEVSAVLAGVLSGGAMIVAYSPTLALYGQPWWRALALPLAATLYAAMTVGSAWSHWRGAGGQWKGRTYS